MTPVQFFKIWICTTTYMHPDVLVENYVAKFGLEEYSKEYLRDLFKELIKKEKENEQNTTRSR